MTKTCVVTPWVTRDERDKFLDAWGVDFDGVPEWLILQQDVHREGCGVTKNKGVLRAVQQGADVVVVLDGDCYPSHDGQALEDLIDMHVQALEPQKVPLFALTTMPPSRGTPYAECDVTLPVAASMGFWEGVPDYDAVRQLAFASMPMEFKKEPVYHRYFPLCGMNVAFRPKEWWPWCQFIDVDRYDDIWMGWLWQREAFRRKHCFNLAGPVIQHARQSNVWKNLIAEARYAKESETLWREIAMAPHDDYAGLLTLLPTGTKTLTTNPLQSPWHTESAR